MKTGCRFRFPLATLLKVRGLREEAARQELAQALARVARSRRALAETRDLLAARLAELGRSHNEAWPAADFLLKLRHLKQLHTVLGGWREQLAREEAEVARKQETLARRHQDRRLLERLRDKARSRFQKELARTLERETEGLTLSRWTSRERAPGGEETETAAGE